MSKSQIHLLIKRCITSVMILRNVTRMFSWMICITKRRFQTSLGSLKKKGVFSNYSEGPLFFVTVLHQLTSLVNFPTRRPYHSKNLIRTIVISRFGCRFHMDVPLALYWEFKLIMIFILMLCDQKTKG